MKSVYASLLEVITVIGVGYGSYQKEEIHQLINTSPFKVSSCFSDSSEMARLMYESDLSIGTAGGTTWERCCLGLPVIAYLAADNQANNMRSLIDKGAAIELKNIDNLALIFDRLFLERMQYFTLVDNALGMCDGNGSKRICSLMENFIVREA